MTFLTPLYVVFVPRKLCSPVDWIFLDLLRARILINSINVVNNVTSRGDEGCYDAGEGEIWNMEDGGIGFQSSLANKAKSMVGREDLLRRRACTCAGTWCMSVMHGLTMPWPFWQRPLITTNDYRLWLVSAQCDARARGGDNSSLHQLRIFQLCSNYSGATAQRGIKHLTWLT